MSNILYYNQNMLTVVIQAGGESSRMGMDKALVPFLGSNLIQRVIGRVAPLADEMLVTTNQPEDYRFLGLTMFADVIPGRGALGGLYTALSAAKQPLVAVVACDMPFVNPKMLAAGRDLLLESDYDAVIPQTPHGTEPFHAVYRKETCLPAVEYAIQQDKWRVDAWYPDARVRLLSEEETLSYDPRGVAFFNVNTLEDLTQAEQIAKQEMDQRS
jgi:molybdopterin-guanine dinucleotide biosynthesis protein A